MWKVGSLGPSRLIEHAYGARPELSQLLVLVDDSGTASLGVEFS